MRLEDKVYSAKIGPNTPEEAEAIHRGIYDGAVRFWRPDKFVKQLLSFREQGFEEFEDRERHYYIGFMVPFYLLKWGGVGLAVRYAPELLPE